MTFRPRMLAAGCGVAGLSVLAAAALAVAAPAKPAAPADTGKICFRIRDVDGISVSSPVGPKTLDGVYLRMNNHDVYQLSLNTVCPELQNSINLGIESNTGAGVICQGIDARIIARDTASGQRRECWGNELHKLNPAETAAIPKRERP
jgi:hypothetical protein